MNVTKKASVRVAGTVSADEVRAAVLAYVRVDQGIVDGKNGVKITDGTATIASDGTASVEIVYEQADVPADVPADATADQAVSGGAAA